MEHPFKVQPATISSIGLAMVLVDTTRTAQKEVDIKVVAGCTVKEAWDLVVLVLKVEMAAAWDRELKTLACTDKVVEMVPWVVATMAAVLVVALWVVEVEDLKIVLSNKAAVVVEMVAVAMLEILKFTLGI